MKASAGRLVQVCWKGHLKNWSAKCRQSWKLRHEKRASWPSFCIYFWQEREDSNPRPPVLETGALPTELRSLVVPLEGLEPPTRDLGRRRSILAELQGHAGGDRGARTPNLGIANAALSQLSYIPSPFLRMIPALSSAKIVYQPVPRVKLGQRRVLCQTFSWRAGESTPGKYFHGGHQSDIGVDVGYRNPVAQEDLYIGILLALWKMIGLRDPGEVLLRLSANKQEPDGLHRGNAR